jgi:hypothetical protein
MTKKDVSTYQSLATKWATKEPEPAPEVHEETPADRRNWLRKQAGWPTREGKKG